jgi:hypothetical protein
VWFVEQTEYFRRRLEELDRKGISFELCEKVVREAEYIEVQEDGRVRFWGMCRSAVVASGHHIT